MSLLSLFSKICLALLIGGPLITPLYSVAFANGQCIGKFRLILISESEYIPDALMGKNDLREELFEGFESIRNRGWASSFQLFSIKKNNVYNPKTSFDCDFLFQGDLFGENSLRQKLDDLSFNETKQHALEGVKAVKIRFPSTEKRVQKILYLIDSELPEGDSFLAGGNAFLSEEEPSESEWNVLKSWIDSRIHLEILLATDVSQKEETGCEEISNLIPGIECQPVNSVEEVRLKILDFLSKD